MARTRAPFARKIAKVSKRSTGRASAPETPLHVRATDASIEAGLADYARQKLGRKLGKFSRFIERVTVRFEDLNGPRGGVDIVSRVKVVLSGLPSIVVEERGTNPRHALDVASHGAERAVRRTLGRAGMTAGRAARAATSSGSAKRRATYPTPPGGSLIGRRVGRASANLKQTQEWSPPLDTSRRGVSATDRKAGRGSTAARNVKLSTSRATATLEDSATGRPSRKSTRASANRAKAGSKQFRRARQRAYSPKSRARRAAARG